MTQEEFHKKWENFWYYYKIHTIAAIVVIIIVAVLVSQCALKVNPDMTVMLVGSSNTYTNDDIAAIQKVFEKYTADVNHDGKKYVYIDNYSMDPKGQMFQTLQQKLIVETETSDSVIYITDDDYFKQITGSSSVKFFVNMKTAIPNAPDNSRVLLNSLPDFKGQSFSARNGGFTLSLKGLKSNKADYKNSVAVLKTLLQNGGLLK